ncbi:MAG: hypothetical protein R3E82_06990 [Pseudomonadales bacterium]
MTGTVIGLALSYAVVAALLLHLNLNSPHGPWIKLATILLVTTLYAGTWFGTRSLLGWASPESLADNFRVLWIALDDPDKSTGTPGAIYYWVRKLDGAGLPVGEPRAHRIAWSEASAEAAQEALERMEAGELLNGRMSRNTVSDAESPPEGSDHAGERALSGDGLDPRLIEFSRVPPPALPSKGVVEDAPAAS